MGFDMYTCISAKLTRVLSELEVPLSVYCTLDNDMFRKPRTGLLALLQPVSGATHLYVGDAAGRPRDHSYCDYAWAMNMGWDFMTPEMFFLKRTKDFPDTLPFDPRVLNTSEALYLPQHLSELLSDELNEQTVILLVGPPGCGKSFGCRHFLSHKAEWINQDLLKDKTKVLKSTELHLKEGRSVVIDRQNHSMAQRKPFLDLASKYKVETICIYLDLPRSYASHANLFRMVMGTGGSHHVI
eukprot:Protomagalhaensia_sp_Gyna_25__4031@NODE_363_length_3706_cov_111_268885_g280_i0_p3_GENE_NODE_363_length_3706_cov_111_268885_g280_i0NODE_363_length_3706_cov_111_268885_g280_i0_p3_ORF_typecomplete_len241_score32_03PNK3P/PF08645_11/4_8e20AAA_33/PF13671_6/3_4e14tRNA_lig_kinase/PF08303_11/1_1e08KTI12/PF08433_10/0_00013AAA_22/PF13401_6/0_00046Zeta_toxin/PF06414_12/0_00092RNA_helicase/PF00910_22/0_001AAA_7/PF12775_7/0_0013PPV_E1_C/PF00519_17/0_0021ATPase/PF06745_13/0_0021T2SSE/PF00437_20/0_012T2SSE/PF00